MLQKRERTSAGEFQQRPLGETMFTFFLCGNSFTKKWHLSSISWPSQFCQVARSSQIDFPAHYIGVVSPPVPEPVSGWHLHLSNRLSNASLKPSRDQGSHGLSLEPRVLWPCLWPALADFCSVHYPESVMPLLYDTPHFFHNRALTLACL